MKRPFPNLIAQSIYDINWNFKKWIWKTFLV